MPRTDHEIRHRSARHWLRRASIPALVAGCALASAAGVQTAPPQPAPATVAAAAPRAVVDKYCVSCHNQRLRTAGLALDGLDLDAPGANADAWERVIAKLRAGSMPPPGRPRPDAATYRAVAGWMEGEIDRAWAAH